MVAADILDLQPSTGVESVCRTSTGGDVPVQVQVGRVDGSEPLLIVTVRDATDLQAGREAKFEAEAKCRALVEQIPAVVYLDPVDENSDSIYVSPQVVTLLGIDREEWLTDPYCWRKHVHPEDLDRAWEEYEDAFNDHTTLDHEYRMVHEDGTIKWVLEQAFPIDDEHGNPWLIQGVIFDISARKAAEEQVALSPTTTSSRACQPRAVRGVARARSRAQARPGRRRRLPRPRQLQARERFPRPRRRRPTTRAARRSAP